MITASVDRVAFTELIEAHGQLSIGFAQEMAVRQIAIVLGARSPFAGQPPELLRWLGLRLTELTFRPGEAIVREGEAADAVYLIARGRVEVVTSARRLTDLGPGEVFGEQAILSGEDRGATVRALDTVHVLALSADDFLDCLARFEDRATFFSRLALQRQRPRRIEHWQIEEQSADTDSVYVLKDIEHHRYLRLNEEGAFLWSLMDGDRTVRDISVAYYERYGRFGNDVVMQAMLHLSVAGFVEVQRTLPGEPGSAGARAGWRRLLPPVSRYFSLPDVDRAVTALYRHLRPLFAAPVQAGLALVTAVGTGVFVWFLSAGHRGGASTAAPLLVATLAFYAQVLIHETAHAVTCKHFGREVHNAGVGWYYFLLVAFVDTSDAWMSGKRPRIAVAAAGPYANALTGGALSLAALGTGGSARALLLAAAGSGYLLAVFNLNPLFESDGYYILTDWLDVPNLREKAFAYLGATIARKTSRIPRRPHRIYLAYGVLALAYVVVLVVSLSIVYRASVGRLARQVVPDPVASGIGLALAGLLGLSVLLNIVRLMRSGTSPGG